MTMKFIIARAKYEHAKRACPECGHHPLPEMRPGAISQTASCEGCGCAIGMSPGGLPRLVFKPDPTTKESEG